MTVDTKKLQQERTSIFQDLMDNKIPKRVPVGATMPLQPLAEWAGIDLAEAHWKPSLIREAAEKMCELLYSDTLPVGGSLRYPSFYQILESQSFVMSSSGYIQHPEVMGMSEEDYDYLIEKPYDCLLERVIPRQYKALDPSDPVKMALSLTKSILAYEGDNAELAPFLAELVEKHGYYPGAPPDHPDLPPLPLIFWRTSCAALPASARMCAGYRKRLVEACEALYPIVLKKAFLM